MITKKNKKNKQGFSLNKALVILGPTSTGKTDLALYFARKFNGEIISCDSRQVYIGMDLGSGKLPSADINIKKYKGYWLMDGIKVWMYDVTNLKRKYSAYAYFKKA